MKPEEQITNLFLQQIAVNTQDKISLLQNELVLSGVAQSPSFVGANLAGMADVFAIEIRIKQTGVPADPTQIARITFTEGDSPTTTHGMYLGNGDLYTVTGKSNVKNFKIISADGGAHIANFVFYGS